jgi:hypothetical protein
LQLNDLIAMRLEASLPHDLRGIHMNIKRSSIPFHGWERVTPVAMMLGLAFGILGLPLAGGAQAADPQHAPDVITIPAGATVLVRMVESVDSTRDRIGDRFSASLEGDLVFNGKSVATKGARVYARLVEVKSTGNIAGKSELRLELTDILINDLFQHIVTSDCEVAGRSRDANTVKTIGMGVEVGAGPHAGTSQVSARGRKVQVPRETLLEFRLKQPLTIPQVSSGN